MNINIGCDSVIPDGFTDFFPLWVEGGGVPNKYQRKNKNSCAPRRAAVAGRSLEGAKRPRERNQIWPRPVPQVALPFCRRRRKPRPLATPSSDFFTSTCSLRGSLEETCCLTCTPPPVPQQPHTLQKDNPINEKTLKNSKPALKCVLERWQWKAGIFFMCYIFLTIFQELH